jgi:CRISPR-associated protein Csb2
MQAYPPQDPEIKDPAAWVESFVAGHRPEGVADHKQFSYIPLPSIGHEHSDAMIRRVMIVAPIGHDAHLRHLADQLDGARLQPLDGSAVKVGPTLNRVARDNIARWYVGTADTWATVTPVILSGHDDHKPAKTEKLIRKALEQSGVDQACEFTWSALPHYKNCLTAHKYDRRRGFVGYHRPGHLKEQTAIHVRLQFQRPVAGPLSIGAGRHCGLGVFCRFDC